MLGIKPDEPGFKTFSIIPFLKDSLSEVRGTMPTPAGNIDAYFNTTSGQCEIHIPKGIIAKKIGLPKAGKNYY